jgi:antitoxin component YwqK of YwqJK toxin-antitoxin module
LTACKNQVDIENVEQREHGLSFVKGTNKLVDGQVTRKFDNGKIAELYNYKDGKAIGNWYAYGYKGETISHGFGVDAKKYEADFPNIDLTYSFLSINIESSFAFASLYLDNQNYFDDPKILLGLSKEIFHEYSSEYNFEDILIYDKEHEYTVSKSATASHTYKIDTVSGKDKKTVFIR